MFTKKSLACVSILCTLALVGCTPTSSSTDLPTSSLDTSLPGGKVGEQFEMGADVHDNVKKEYDKIPAKTIDYINYPNFSNDNYAPS